MIFLATVPPNSEVFTPCRFKLPKDDRNVIILSTAYDVEDAVDNSQVNEPKFSGETSSEQGTLSYVN